MDRSKYDYYQAKHATEGLIEQGPLPWTIVCTTQFHNYVLWLIKFFGADTQLDASSFSQGTGNRKAIVTVLRLSVYLLH